MADETTTADETVQPAAPANADGATEMPPMGDEGGEGDWSPPAKLEDGTPVDGHGLPLNLRLRKAALADAGKSEDPVGVVSADDIAAEVARLKAYDSQYPALRANMKTAELEKLAKSESVDISSAETNEDRVGLIAAARPLRV